MVVTEAGSIFGGFYYCHFGRLAMGDVLWTSVESCLRPRLGCGLSFEVELRKA
jgi:hypothetical protein